MQENKQISETKKIYKPLVKKKESESKRTYNGTRRTQWSSQKKERNTRVEKKRKREAPKRKKVWKRKWRASKLG